MSVTMDDMISNEKIINDIVDNIVGVCPMCGKINEPGRPNGLPMYCDCNGRINPICKTALNLEKEELFFGNTSIERR